MKTSKLTQAVVLAPIILTALLTLVAEGDNALDLNRFDDMQVWPLDVKTRPEPTVLTLYLLTRSGRETPRICHAEPGSG